MSYQLHLIKCPFRWWCTDLQSLSRPSTTPLGLCLFLRTIILVWSFIFSCYVDNHVSGQFCFEGKIPGFAVERLQNNGNIGEICRFPASSQAGVESLLFFSLSSEQWATSQGRSALDHLWQQNMGTVQGVIYYSLIIQQFGSWKQNLSHQTPMLKTTTRMQGVCFRTLTKDVPTERKSPVKQNPWQTNSGLVSPQSCKLECRDVQEHHLESLALKCVW